MNVSDDNVVAIGGNQVSVNLELGQIKHTILAVDKDQYYSETILFRIIWAPYTYAGFTTTNAMPALAGLANLATSFQITSLNVYLAMVLKPKLQLRYYYHIMHLRPHFH